MSKILIDGRFIGVGDSQTRYVLELLENILKVDKENEYTLLIRPIAKSIIENWKTCPPIRQVENLNVDVLDIKHYSFAEQTKLLGYLNKEKFDLVHFTQFNHPVLYRGKFVTTVQDLTLIGHLHYQNFVKQFAFKLVMGDAARRSRKIIAISKFTRDDVVDYFGTPKEKFKVIYHGVDHERFGPRIKNYELRIKNFKEKYHISGDYILYTGMWKKHKNLLRLLKAYEQFSNSAIQQSSNPTKLVLVGKIDKKEPEVLAEIDRINKLMGRKLPTTHYPLPTIITTGFIDDSELPIAYGGALAYCIPSLSEGFGWPPLEAMACGTAVIASNASCIPEILGDAACYFDPYSEKDIAKSIDKINSDETLRKDLIKKGLEQVKKYNWEKTAKETLEVYNEALS